MASQRAACGFFARIRAGVRRTHRLAHSFAHARARFHFICQAGEARMAEPKTCAFYFGNSSDGNGNGND